MSRNRSAGNEKNNYLYPLCENNSTPRSLYFTIRSVLVPEIITVHVHVIRTGDLCTVISGFLGDLCQNSDPFSVREKTPHGEEDT